jgi:3-hydroxyacyl-CoA dehydrogenase
MINIGCGLLEQGAALRPEDIDVVFVLGLGFPRHRGGPMWWAERDVGLVNIAKALLLYQDMYPNRPWFKSTQLLKNVVAAGATIREEMYFSAKK